MSAETTKVDDGGPAFPQPETKNGNTVADEHGQGGMSLRDYFAGQALAGLVASDKASRIADDWERRGKPKPAPEVVDAAIAQCAYIYADAMLAARAEGGAA